MGRKLLKGFTITILISTHVRKPSYSKPLGFLTVSAEIAQTPFEFNQDNPVRFW
jgi:hypothetical protein